MTTAAEAATVTEFAPAKVNLALHVTGRRADGYHLLDSLVVFAPVGDRISVAPAAELSLSITGPFAAEVPAGDSNLVLRAARLLAESRGATIELEKILPVASGIGGGSADAAATLRALSRLWELPLPAPEAVARLGADVPVCLEARPARMRGIGEVVEPLPGPVPVYLLLVNPGRALATPEMFARLDRRHAPPLADPPHFATATDVARYAAACRNDLEASARALVPEIGSVLDAITATGDCLLARMSGSGATCFGLYPDAATRDRARVELSAGNPDWWVAA